jgi:hypothetical protein
MALPYQQHSNNKGLLKFDIALQAVVGIICRFPDD